MRRPVPGNQDQPRRAEGDRSAADDSGGDGKADARRARQARRNPPRAQGNRESAILEAEGEKEAAILAATGAKEASILEAQGDKQSEVLRAEGQAQAIDSVFTALRSGEVSENILSYLYLQMLPHLADNPANKVFVIPTEFTDALNGLGALSRGHNGEAESLRRVLRSKTLTRWRFSGSTPGCSGSSRRWSCIGAELLVSFTFYFGPVALAAFVAAAAAALNASTELQVALFAVSSILSLVFVRPVARRHLIIDDNVKTGAELLVGKRAIATSDVSVDGGTVKIDGQDWSARIDDEDTVIPAGSRVTVLEFRGIQAIVEAD